MKIYQLRELSPSLYARAVRVGTWKLTGDEGLCKVCQRSLEERVPPLVIEWLPGSAEIADFTWPGILSDLMVTQRVRAVLETRDKKLRFLPVEMKQEPRVRRPVNPKRGKPRVWLPYEGPPLWDLWVDDLLPLNLEASGFRLQQVCTGCGYPTYDKPPIERRWLVVNGKGWSNSLFFRIKELPSPFFTTEEGKDLMERNAFTNVSFVERGHIEF